MVRDEGNGASVTVLYQQRAQERVALPEEHFMGLAFQAAEQGMERGEMPFGACLVRDGRVVSTAHNSVKSARDATAHAEVQALREAGRRVQPLDLVGSVLYTTCEPCPMCFAACLWVKVSRIVYACRIEDAEKIGIRQIPIPSALLNQLSRSNVELTSDVLRDQGMKLFDSWQKKRMTLHV